MNVSILPNAGQADVATSYVETYKAMTAFANGSIQTTIPSGWTPAQASNAGAPGYVSAAHGSCASVGAIPTVTPLSGGGEQVRITGVTCAAGESLTLTYSQADALKAGSYMFGPTSVQTASSASSVPVPSPAVTESPGPTAQFVFTAPSSSTTAGAHYSFTVTPEDAGGDVSDYHGTVAISSSDHGASTMLPAPATIGGAHTFTATLTTAGQQTLTATDTGTSSISSTLSGIQVTAAAATHFVVSAPAGATQGQAVSVTVTALDAYGNIATGYRGTVHFTTTDTGTGRSLPANYTFTAGDGGSHTFTNGVTFVTPGTQTVTVTATDTGPGSITGTSAGVVVSAATHFSVTAPAAATAGQPVSVTVTALDQSNHVVPGYRGTVHFITTDTGSGRSVPVDYTFTGGDAGSHTFAGGVTFVTAGSQTVTATDTGTRSITGTSSGVSVSAAPATHFSVSAPATATAGLAVGVTVAALDQFGNVDDGYRGTVHFTSSDGGSGSALPGDYTFLAGDGGSRTFAGGATFVTAGSQTVTATDTGTPSITGTSSGVSVSGATATHLSVSAPATATAGQAIDVTVTALDRFGNTATGYQGTVHFTSSDNRPGRSLPVDYTFVAGDGGSHTFAGSVTFVTAGSQTVTATDSGTPSITGTSSGVAVTGAPATHFSVSAPATAIAGQPVGVTVTAFDQFGNTATGYRGTLHFTSTDTGSGVGLPGDYLFLASDGGSHTFAGGVTFATAGSQTVTATDTGTGSITGTSGGVSVSAGPVAHLSVSAPLTATAGQAVSVTVTALDASGNVVTGYDGTVHFTGSDTGSGAALPANYTFVASDAGSHTFTNGVTFVTAGSQVVTVTDTGTSSITGTSAAVSVSGAGTPCTGTPTAVITPSTGEMFAGTVLVSGLNSSDPCGRPLEYFWNCTFSEDTDSCQALIDEGPTAGSFDLDIETGVTYNLGLTVCVRGDESICSAEEASVTYLGIDG